jgi:predicted RNA-binding Zn ribbon-like protein
MSMRAVSKFVAGNIALDFCNTAGEHLAANFDEMLLDWETFIRWCVQAGLVAQESYAPLTGRPFPMEPVIQLREAIYRAGLGLARGQAIPAGDLDLIVRSARASRPLVQAGTNGLHWRPATEHSSQQLRALLAGEALSLICSPRAVRIGVCEGGACGWLFMDDSRGKRRRWCDMKDCGSRAKARSFYQRHKNCGPSSSQQPESD